MKFFKKQPIVKANVWKENEIVIDMTGCSVADVEAVLSVNDLIKKFVKGEK